MTYNFVNSLILIEFITVMRILLNGVYIKHITILSNELKNV